MYIFSQNIQRNSGGRWKLILDSEPYTTYKSCPAIIATQDTGNDMTHMGDI